MRVDIFITGILFYILIQQTQTEGPTGISWYGFSADSVVSRYNSICTDSDLLPFYKYECDD